MPMPVRRSGCSPQKDRFSYGVNRSVEDDARFGATPSLFHSSLRRLGILCDEHLVVVLRAECDTGRSAAEHGHEPESGNERTTEEASEHRGAIPAHDGGNGTVEEAGVLRLLLLFLLLLLLLLLRLILLLVPLLLRLQEVGGKSDIVKVADILESICHMTLDYAMELLGHVQVLHELFDQRVHPRHVAACGILQ